MPEIKVLKEVLTKAVTEAHIQAPNVLGVLLFGSQSHPGTARPDSDVDLVNVQKRMSVTGTYILHDAVKRILYSLGLKSDFKGLLSLEWVEISLLSQPNVNMADLLRINTRWLDRDSVFILADPEAERKIREFVKLEEREWTRAGLHRSASPTLQVG